MPRKDRAHDPEEAEDDLKFLADLESNPRKTSGAGRTKEERRMLAHELLYCAGDAKNPLETLSLAMRAVRLDPACLDARVILAQLAGGPEDELIEELQQIVALGESDLGPKVFAELTGFFWLEIDTRPYMRVRSLLARALYLAGRFDESIAHHRDLLKLNPQDNLGLRYGLIGCYLEDGRLEEAHALLDQFNEESAFWLWARVLERFLAGDTAEAGNVRTRARQQNRHVEDFLRNKRKVPDIKVPYFSPGDISEAIECMAMIGPAWKKNPAAIAWLVSNRPKARRNYVSVQEAE